MIKFFKNASIGIVLSLVFFFVVGVISTRSKAPKVMSAYDLECEARNLFTSLENSSEWSYTSGSKRKITKNQYLKENAIFYLFVESEYQKQCENLDPDRWLEVVKQTFDAKNYIHHTTIVDATLERNEKWAPSYIYSLAKEYNKYLDKSHDSSPYHIIDQTIDSIESVILGRNYEANNIVYARTYEEVLNY